LRTIIYIWVSTVPDRYGLFTKLQLQVLKLRSRGLSLREVAEKIGTTRQNIQVAEKRARNNVRVAEETILIYTLITAPLKVKIEAGTHLVDIPKIVIEKADEAGVKVRADFTLIYKLLHFKTQECIQGPRLVKPVLILVTSRGDVEIFPYDKIKEYLTLVGDP